MTTLQISALFNECFYIASGFCWRTLYALPSWSVGGDVLLGQALGHEEGQRHDDQRHCVSPLDPHGGGGEGPGEAAPMDDQGCGEGREADAEKGPGVPVKAE